MSDRTVERQRILFICGSMNQTTQMHQISMHLQDYACAFTPYYATGIVGMAARHGILENTILGSKLGDRALAYMREHGLHVDPRGQEGGYHLAVTCSDLVIPATIRCPMVLVQEGMTDPEPWFFPIIQHFRFVPRWLASTASTGLSDRYEYFCVASDGYRKLFLEKGVKDGKLIVTGIPNFDNVHTHLVNDFPHRHYVLVCTSDTRETGGREDRRRMILDALQKANGRLLIFKLHPNEHVERATREIHHYAPQALIFTNGPTEAMIANCDVLITSFSTTVYVGLALGKEVYSAFDVAVLKRLIPVQHGRAAMNIAAVCRSILEDPTGRPARPLRRVWRHRHTRRPRFISRTLAWTAR